MGAIAKGLIAYMQPLIAETDGSLEQLNKAISIGQLCYNLALLPEDKRDKAMEEMRLSLQMDEEEFKAFRDSAIMPMIQRHQEMFPRMHQRISTDSWQNGPSLQSQPRTLGAQALEAQSRMEAPVETYPEIDRYAPCPCNSGQKYKFCCGKKRH